MTLEDIKNCVFNGLRLSLEDSYKFLGVEYLKTKPEYLCTINTAKELSNFKLYPNSPPSILIEARRSHFLYSSHPSSSGLMKIQKIPKPNYSQYRRQRIDIALYQKESAFCPIELKLFNPPMPKVKYDLKRNLKYLEIKSSTVKFTVFGCLFFYKKSKLLKNINSDKKNAKSRFMKIANDVTLGTNIKSTVEVKTLSKDLIYKGKYSKEQIERDTGDILNESYHFMGVIIILKK
jgi:hypothetical protein